MRIVLLCLALVVACSNKKSDATDDKSTPTPTAKTCDEVPAKLAPFTIKGRLKNAAFSVVQVPFEQSKTKTTFEFVLDPSVDPFNPSPDASDRSRGTLAERVKPGRYEVVPIGATPDRPFQARIFDFGTKIRMDAAAGTLVVDEVTPTAIKAHFENLVLQDYVESEGKLVGDGCRATAERVTLDIELI